jgi:hypothetical protein
LDKFREATEVVSAHGGIMNDKASPAIPLRTGEKPMAAAILTFSNDGRRWVRCFRSLIAFDKTHFCPEKNGDI